MKKTTKLTLYEKAYAYSTTWLEMVIDSHPAVTAAVTSVVVWALFL